MKQTLRVAFDAWVKQGAIAAKETARAFELRELVLSICDHPETKMVEHHFPGSYYDKEEWVTHEHCAICSKDLGVRKRYVGGYG
jgi:hypothetical protein